MSNTASIAHAFTELCYGCQLDDIPEALNAQFADKALELRATVKNELEWRCDTFATLDSTYALLEDPLFAPLVQSIGRHVSRFAAEYGVSDSAELRCMDGWINVAEQGEYQEVHIHPSRHFSAVYYVAAKADSGNLVFRSHESLTDMMPLPVSSTTHANCKTFSITPQTGNLLIFRSNLPHMVEKNKTQTPRISVAMNFVFA